MSFFNFISLIFAWFQQILSFIQNIFSTLMSNNLIVFSLCLAVFFFLIDFHFEIIGLLPRIIHIVGERDKEFSTNTVTKTRSDFDKQSGITTIYTSSKIRRRKK